MVICYIMYVVNRYTYVYVYVGTYDVMHKYLSNSNFNCNLYKSCVKSMCIFN